MPTINLPEIRYPFALDDYRSLMLVLNQSEAMTREEVKPSSTLIPISWDYDLPERFSKWGGYAQIMGEHVVEDIYYGRGIWVYKDNPTASLIEEGYIPSGNEFKIGTAVIPNGLHISNGLDGNAVTIIGERYTCIGVLQVGGVMVDFAIQHVGGEIDRSRFYFSRPDLFQTDLSHMDADTGVIMLFPFDFGMKILSIRYKEVMRGNDGEILRRVNVLTDIRRGLRNTGVYTHHKGSYVRGYIMAEHHMLAAKGAMAIQKHIGANFSEDEQSLDFRLRDLNEICVEGDDWPCPEITFDFRPVETEDECVVINTFQFNLTVDGNFSSFGIFFGDGQSSTDNLNPIHSYPPNSRVEPSVFASNENCRVANASFEDQAQSVSDIPEIPGLVCPEITVPDIPAIPEALIPNFTAPTTIINIDTPSFPFQSFDFSQSIFISVPSSISIFTSFNDIEVNIPPITVDVNFQDPPDITVNFSVNIDYPPEAGPCFALVPCGGYCHGS